MKRYLLLIAVLGALLNVGLMPASAQVFTDPSWLKIDYVRVNVDIDNQIASTEIDMQFTNEGEGLAEGTFVFPLPEGAAVDELIMYIDGTPIEARILPAGEAREIYNQIVRQFRDPALLEYVGSNAIQANVFPIPPGESRRIEIAYSHLLQADNGLIHYLFPMNATRAISPRSIDQMNIAVNVQSNDPISSIYSPSHPIAINRAQDTDNAFRAGWEASNVLPGDDFSLFYGIATDTINVNLLSYRESANQDGFFMLLVQPPLTVDESEVIPKDVIIVLDQSGSMAGDKWDQAREAASYVLESLNSGDRFNLIVFSSGARVYSNDMEAASLADDAINWIQSMEASGGTDINLALTSALDLADTERPTTILFLTDGLATEGEVDTEDILDNLEEEASPNVRIFTFGVGDDVDTFLLDAIVRDFRGAGSYVRPDERIDEEVSSLYNKISAPVLTDIDLDFGDVRVDLLYPTQLPDLFAGEQLTVVGRFRDTDDSATITLSGEVGGESRTFVYSNLSFRERAGGEAFIARLWATRRIGDLLNTIRLRGENTELVDSIVNLSLRYGIITPYTSFLIEEDDILSQTGRDEVMNEFEETARDLSGTNTGEAAVDAADAAAGLAAAEAPMATTPTAQGTAAPDMDGQVGGSTNAIRTVGERTFIQLNGVWTDTTFEPDTMTTVEVPFLSDAYFDLLDERPELAGYFALGERVIVVLDDVAYEVTTP
jgi:Ca-activated chloride channel family protein